LKFLSNELIIKRLTALWAFSEAAIGGILHVFKLPFKGIFIAGAAVIFISLIGFYSKNRGTILKSTFIVLIVKGIISPHASLTAFVAVLVQGVLGEFIFSQKKQYRYSPIIFGAIVLTLSAIQKILILTIVFGNTFWYSIDELAVVIYTMFFPAETLSNLPSISLLIIFGYTFIHLASGLLVGILASRLPNKIGEITNGDKYSLLQNDHEQLEIFYKKQKKKSWWKKPSRIFILLIILIILFSTFFFNNSSSDGISDIFVMIIRGVTFLLIWYYFLSPLVRKLLHKILKRKKSKYLDEVEEIMEFFPAMKMIFSQSLNESKTHKGFKRITFFIERTFSLALTSSVNENQNESNI
jgi:hypothetical protein